MPPTDAREPRQLTLLPPAPAPARTPADRAAERRVGECVRDALGPTARLVLNDNRVNILSLRRRAGTATVRLHRMFLAADEQVLRALGRYLARGDKRAGKALDAFIAAQRAREPAPPSRRAPTPLRARGAVYDLDELQRALSERYFGGEVRVKVTWGRASAARKPRGRQTARLGLYLYDEELIRVHPVLDQEWVPPFFVAWVLYHEMLHHLLPVSEKGGRREVHTREFRARERRYEHYEQARAWEADHMSRLLASRGKVAARERRAQ